MEIVFKKHCLDRYRERMRNIDGYHIFKENNREFVKIECLEKEIRNGSFYFNKKQKNKLLILYNNLKVYVASIDYSENVITVETVYPYKKGIRGWINTDFKKVELF